MLRARPGGVIKRVYQNMRSHASSNLRPTVLKYRDFLRGRYPGDLFLAEECLNYKQDEREQRKAFKTLGVWPWEKLQWVGEVHCHSNDGEPTKDS